MAPSAASSVAFVDDGSRVVIRTVGKAERYSVRKTFEIWEPTEYILSVFHSYYSVVYSPSRPVPPIITTVALRVEDMLSGYEEEAATGSWDRPTLELRDYISGLRLDRGYSLQYSRVARLKRAPREFLQRMLDYPGSSVAMALRARLPPLATSGVTSRHPLYRIP